VRITYGGHLRTHQKQLGASFALAKHGGELLAHTCSTEWEALERGSEMSLYGRSRVRLDQTEGTAVSKGLAGA
jgi:hypothetical protein